MGDMGQHAQLAAIVAIVGCLSLPNESQNRSLTPLRHRLRLDKCTGRGYKDLLPFGETSLAMLFRQEGDVDCALYEPIVLTPLIMVFAHTY